MSSGIWEINAFTLFKTGGPLMWPILFCSFFSIGFIIEKFLYLFSIKTNVFELKRNIFDHVKNNKIKEAVQLCESSPSPVAKILKAGVIKFGCSKEEIKESMEEAGLFEIPKLENRLNALSTIAQLCPLIGLLGTTTGLISCFHTIQIKTASLNPVTPGDLAGGIGEALLTTVAGLMVAIPTFVAYNYFISQINHFVLEMERAATELINYLNQITETNTQ